MKIIAQSQNEVNRKQRMKGEKGGYDMHVFLLSLLVSISSLSVAGIITTLV
ncbi:MAG: hypothetical protein SXQ77_05445 [Halobacteria archaeon]|nr:hypothetical protein [Halobacteria archaeon]